MAKSLMSLGSYKHLVGRTRLYGASFGKAIERRVAQLIRLDPDLSARVFHTGIARVKGRFVSSPDFTEKVSGEIFDVTTNAAKASHVKRYGGKEVTYLLYDVLKGLEF